MIQDENFEESCDIPKNESPEPVASLQERRAADVRLQSIKKLRDKIEAVLWVTAALGTMYYGDGETDIVHCLASPIVLVLSGFADTHSLRCNRQWLYVGLGLLAANISIFLYLYVW
eukprot:scaffold118572_cov25-Prasinocladus_malaysianus.AAC.1